MLSKQHFIMRHDKLNKSDMLCGNYKVLADVAFETNMIIYNR